MKNSGIICLVGGFFFSSSAFAKNHAAGLQVGRIAELNAQVENVSDGFPFKGDIARFRYEFRDQKTSLFGGVYLQHLRAENRNADPSNEHNKETLISTGGGFHIGVLIGGAGAFDMGLGFQPARFERVSSNGDENVTYKHSYKSGFNLNAGLTLTPSYGKLGIPLRVQYDMTSLSAGNASNDRESLLREVTMYSSSFLAGIDILY